jgi:hypothetical protein
MGKMKKKVTFITLAGFGLATAILAWVFTPQTGQAHCDTLDGPVVAEARTALDKGDVTPVLKWVHKEDEAEISKAFQGALDVRKLSPQTQELADMYFFETLVRIHRAAEDAPYTGLKPAGQVEPVVAAADNAIRNNSVDGLVREVSSLVTSGIHQRFKRLMQAKKHKDENVASGRQYVEAYVEFVHYVERLHNDASGSAAHHEDSEKASAPAEHVH